MSDRMNGNRNKVQNKKYSNRRKSRRQSVISAKLAVALFTFVLVLGGVLLGSSLSGSRESKASDEAQNCKYYTSVRIEEGDSLWDIAGEYMTEEYENKTAYIAEVKELNQLGDDEIHTGEYLVVPYYSQEQL
ncbi:MAG: LysM peptidoglycan-binding domain-containing protein [Lachnospiraceae bacterium]|nr:LysM peptidoglycan-binding domain-containing protein [Lachnospiraceae bacterium]MDD7377752.1 LysM peptidoglycan-binding domain-containing protein [Lachnospiraceae bacterium]MDY4616187.1 LysM peptidoglycan-binding domain-containing protein [Lachnospiraceae bacterium]